MGMYEVWISWVPGPIFALVSVGIVCGGDSLVLAWDMVMDMSTERQYTVRFNQTALLGDVP
jgi:hypothetical protein